MLKLSVIIPVYNTEPYLEKCLDSIVNQTLQDIEIIIVNDCSLDNSEDIILRYQKKDSRIKYIKHKVNKGLYYARETGVNNACGDYIIHVDSDDTINLQLCEKIYPLTLSSPDCITYHILFDYGSHLEYSEWINRNLQDFNKDKEFFHKICALEIHPGAIFQKVTKRTLSLHVYKEINLSSNLIMGEDQLYNIWYSYYCSSVKHLDFNGYFYNAVNNTSVTRSPYDLKKSLWHLDQLSIIKNKLLELCSLKNLPSSTIEPILTILFSEYLKNSYSINIINTDIVIPKIIAIFDLQIITSKLFLFQQDLFLVNNNRWYQFGQLSIKKTLIVLLKKIHLYSPIKFLYNILRNKRL